MLNLNILAALRRLAALSTPASLAATRVRLTLLARDIVQRDHIADVSRRLRRSLASRPRKLSPEQLSTLGTGARITGDRELAAAAMIAPWSTAAMARCVAAQDAIDEGVALGRLVQEQAVELEIGVRREYQPWQSATVAEVVL